MKEVVEASMGSSPTSKVARLPETPPPPKPLFVVQSVIPRFIGECAKTDRRRLVRHPRATRSRDIIYLSKLWVNGIASSRQKFTFRLSKAENGFRQFLRRCFYFLIERGRILTFKVMTLGVCNGLFLLVDYPFLWSLELYQLLALKMYLLHFLEYFTLRKNIWLNQRKLFVWKIFFDLRNYLFEWNKICLI